MNTALELGLGLLTGIFFGAVLMLSGLSTPRLIIDMLRFKDLRLLKVLVTALTTGILGVTVLDDLGLAHLSVKTLHVASVLLGGVVFGLGFALSGFCPGTSLAAAAEGRRDALFVVAGGLLGAGAYAAVYGFLEPILVAPLTYGKPVLHGLLGVPRWAVALPLGAAGIIAIWWWLGEEGRRGKAREEEKPVAAAGPMSGRPCP